MRQSMAFAALVSVLLACTPAAAASPAAQTPGERQPVRFTVTNPDERFAERTVVGTRLDPACDASTVVLLQHGLSYTGAAWDVPGLSTMQILADAGYAVVAVDRLGYGGSPLDDGYAVSSESYGHMAAEIVSQLRTAFNHVVIGGHSAGAEASLLSVGLFRADVEALLVMGYHQVPTPEILGAFMLGDVPGTLTSDYVYFLGTPEYRAEMFYTDDADADVIAADTAAAVLTPSGEIQSIGKQPSRLAAPLVTVPVFLQLAEHDRLFDASMADVIAAQFVASPGVDVDIVAGAGHTFMLHRGGPAAARRLADWLRAQPGTPPCTTPAAQPPPAALRPSEPPPDPSPVAQAPAAALPATGAAPGGLPAGLVLLALGAAAAIPGRRRCRAAPSTSP
jgi:pimeloyl-ACP methyl ester carboxylesterase